MNITAFWELPWFKQTLPINLFGISGRATRRHYLVVFLLTVTMLIVGVEETNDTMRVIALVFAALILLTGTIRRLHDAELAWWWMLFGFVPYIGIGFLGFAMFQAGTRGKNKYGLDPRGRIGWDD